MTVIFIDHFTILRWVITLNLVVQNHLILANQGGKILKYSFLRLHKPSPRYLSLTKNAHGDNFVQIWPLLNSNL